MKNRTKLVFIAILQTNHELHSF